MSKSSPNNVGKVRKELQVEELCVWGGLGWGGSLNINEGELQTGRQ